MGLPDRPAPSPNMGEGLGDQGRKVDGTVSLIIPSGHGWDLGTSLGEGCFDAKLDAGTPWSANGGSNKKYIYYLKTDSSRVVPAGAANIPRSWGALACVYLGWPG